MKFLKLESCSNDFCVVKYDESVDYTKLAVKLCNRLIGVGALGVIVYNEEPLEVTLYNEFGDIIDMNAFAVFSFARYYTSIDNNLKNKWSFINNGKEILIEGIANSYKVKIAKPNFTNQAIYVRDMINSFGRILTVEGYHLTIYSFQIDVAQTVIFIDSLDSSYFNIAKEISENKLFKKGTNVHFVKINNESEVVIRTYIYGQGYVKSSAYGAASAIICGHKLGVLNNNINVIFEYGSVKATIKKGEVILEGSSRIVFEGELKEENLC